MLLQAFHSVLLILVASLALFIRLCEILVAAVANAFHATSDKAMGAPGVIGWWMNVNLRTLNAAKRPLASYLGNHHPEAHHRLQQFLVSRR